MGLLLPDGIGVNENPKSRNNSIDSNFVSSTKSVNVMGNVPLRQVHTFRVQPVVTLQDLSIATHVPAIVH